MEDLTSVIINTAAESLYTSRKEASDPEWDKLDLFVRGYYRRIAVIRMRQGITCAAVAPNADRCVLIPGHEGQHERTSKWD